MTKITIERKDTNGRILKSEFYSSKVVVDYVDDRMVKRNIHGRASFMYVLNELAEQIKNMEIES